jgi:hypothetical protein
MMAGGRSKAPFEETAEWQSTSKGLLVTLLCVIPPKSHVPTTPGLAGILVSVWRIISNPKKTK